MGRAFLLTGHPGSGKTTFIRAVIAQVACNAGGFYTQDIREGGKRVGFKLVTLEGRAATMAHVDFPKTYRVGKYGVDLEVIDRLGVQSVRRAISSGNLVVIDEIGPMEMLSPRFISIVMEALEHETPLLGTIVRRTLPFVETVRALPGVEIHVLDRLEEERLMRQALHWLQDAGLV